MSFKKTLLKTDDWAQLCSFVFAFLVSSFTLCLVGCDVEDNKVVNIPPEVSVPEGYENFFVEDIYFDRSADERKVAFQINVGWVMKVVGTDGSSVSWCSVESNSGDAGLHKVLVRVTENNTYELRSAKLQLMCNEAKVAEIVIIQDYENAILLDMKTCNISFDDTSVNIDMKSNVEFECEVLHATWIRAKQSTTRALTNHCLVFEVDENTYHEDREAHIRFYNIDHNINEVLTLVQKGNPNIKPSVWYSHMDSLLGTWSREKHIFLARLTGDNHFYEKLYDDSQGGHIFADIIDLNAHAVNALLASEDSIDGELKDSIALAIDFPILQRDYNPAYTEPYFWNNLKGDLGYFKAEKLTRLGGRLGGTSVKELIELCEAYDGANGELKTALKALNKELVPEMLDEYNRNAQNGLTLADYDPQSIVKLGTTVDYTDVPQPFWWEDPKGLGTADVVKKYFGAYERKKYLFMIREVAKVEDANTFIAASLFPFVYNVEAGTYSWDTTPVGPNQLAGEERLKECYRIIKAANDKRFRPFDIPEVEQ